MTKSFAALSVLVLITAAAGRSFVDDPPATQPSTAPAATEPGPAISADAKTLLGPMRDAYKSLKSLSLTGTITGEFDVNGQKESPTVMLASEPPKWKIRCPSRCAWTLKGRFN